MARLGFDANEVAPDTGGGPLPDGIYQFHVSEESLEAASSGKGDVLKLVYEVISDSYNGRKVFVNMNISHSNPVAQKIGQAELSALCHATGQMQVEDSEELLWKPFSAETKTVTEEYKGKERQVTRIKKYHFGEDAGPPVTKAPPRQAAAPQRPAAAPSRGPGVPASGRSLPWGGGGRIPATIDDDIPF